MSNKTHWPELTVDQLPPRKSPKARKPGQGSRRHPLLRARPKGVWYPDLVGVIKSYPKTQEAFDKLQARCREQIIRLNASDKPPRRTGVKDGMARQSKKLQALREEKLDEAKRIVDIMVEKSLVDPKLDEMGREMLEYAVSVVRTPSNTEKTADKLKAAAMVLEYTRTKPASKSEVTLNKAEDFLAKLADEANGKA